MTRKIWIFLMYTTALSLLFSYEKKFSYTNIGGNLNKISLHHAPELISIEGEFTRLVKEGQGHTSETGMPELPTYSTFYQIDPQKIYEYELDIIESYIIDDIRILPYQGVENEWDIKEITHMNQEFYLSAMSFPSENLIVSDRMPGRGVELVNIQVIPYTYHPSTNQLEVFSQIEVNIIEVGDNPDHQLDQPKRSHIFDKLYQDFIVNFEISLRDDDYQHSAILYIGGGSSLSNSYVQDLIEWRHKQGYIVYTATESEVGGSSASTSEIKNYIQNAMTWENPPEIVGLIGDTNGTYSLPCNYHNWGGGWYGYEGATDFDYTQLIGNDLLADVLIGRISAEDSNDLNNIINKTIQYEKGIYQTEDFFQGAALLGDPSSSGNSTIFTNQYIENIMINHGFENRDIQTYYQSGNADNWVEDQFDSGILFYNYRGYYGASGVDESGFNNGYDNPFVTSLTCGTGDYDYTSDSESFIQAGSVNNPKGAVAAVGVSTLGTHTAYNNIVDMGIYDGIFPKNLEHAAAAVTNGHIAIFQTYPSNPGGCAETFISWTNLMGDPALHLWSGVPTNFGDAVDHPSSITLGTNTMDITVYNDFGDSVEGARVTLLMGNDVIFTSGLTDIHGQITLNWEAIESGTMYITVIKRNHRPYESTIEISSAAGAAIAIDSSTIEVNAGEITDFDISLHNYGSIAAENIVAELSSPSENVTIDNAIISYGTIIPGASVSKSFPVTIHGTAFNMEDLECTLTITDDNDNLWVNYVPVNISGPHLIISDYSGETLPGATTNLTINIVNEGSKAASNFKLDLLPYENLVTVNMGWAEVDNLSVGSNILLEDFDLSFSNTIINGSILPLELLFTSADGFTRNQIINVTVGETRETDPLGPDLYGYYIYDSGDTEYEFAPVYDWIEVVEGDENKLPISDGGNGTGSYQNGSIVLDLPFIFTFYGEDYDQIVVNTNGWISFGNFEMYSFRNYPIPGAGGPSPMVAAFWDDLKTGSNGHVHHFETDEMVVIQWDYMRTYNNGSRETFEIILYNKEYGTPTITGDSEIKIQYQDFNNTSNGYYPEGGTPTHGCYSTIGIENHLGDIGLEYTFNNAYPEAAATLQDGSAIFITTRTEYSYILGDVNGDGVLDVLDVVGLINAVLSGNYIVPGDMNQDGILDILDIVTLINTILS